MKPLIMAWACAAWYHGSEADNERHAAIALVLRERERQPAKEALKIYQHAAISSILLMCEHVLPWHAR